MIELKPIELRAMAMKMRRTAEAYEEMAAILENNQNLSEADKSAFIKLLMKQINRIQGEGAENDM